VTEGRTADGSGLLDRIVADIRTRGPMSFARFMDLALHDPADGYYAAGADRLGPGGDFFTASDVGTAFGRCIARQLAEMDRALGDPDPFVAVEFGAGRGWLAGDVVSAAAAGHPDLGRRLRYLAVDRSPGMRRSIAATLGPDRALAPDDPAVADPDRCGCALAVELLDALPVHRVRRRAGAVVEVAVDVDDDGPDGPALVECERPAPPAVVAEVQRWGLTPEEGDEGEVALGLAGELARMAGAIGRGFLIVVDYGHDADELADRSHARGTLLAYHRHRTREDVLSRVGRQDLTAHVNWSAMVAHAARAGWSLVGRTTQDRFLIANGILEDFEDGGDGERWRDPARVKARLQAMQLIHPEGMGRTFEVFVFSRGLPFPSRLGGLVDPFAR